MAEKQLIITIGREFGSGGHVIGEMLAEKLGIGFYDAEIIQNLSEKKGVAEEMLTKYDEKPSRILMNRTVRGYSTSIEEIKKLCSENTGTACIILGALHQNLYNDAFKKDFSEAQKFYAKACDLDDGAGCYWLGRFSLEGTTGEIDHEKSLTYLNKACDLDDPEGCYLLGKMYETGTGVEKGLDSALKYYQKSCRWIGKGCESLSHLYAKGIGVKQDLGLAVHYYLLSEKGFNMSETYGTYGENSIIPASEFPLEEVKKQLKTGCDSDDAKSCLLYGSGYSC